MIQYYTIWYMIWYKYNKMYQYIVIFIPFFHDLTTLSFSTFCNMMIRNQHLKTASMTSSDNHIVKKLKWWLSAVWHYEVCPRNTQLLTDMCRELCERSHVSVQKFFISTLSSVCAAISNYVTPSFISVSTRKVKHALCMRNWHWAIELVGIMTQNFFSLRYV
jgi:hypothetical protein